LEGKRYNELNVERVLGLKHNGKHTTPQRLKHELDVTTITSSKAIKKKPRVKVFASGDIYHYQSLAS
jgi:hypothetical protein